MTTDFRSPNPFDANDDATPNNAERSAMGDSMDSVQGENGTVQNSGSQGSSVDSNGVSNNGAGTNGAGTNGLGNGSGGDVSPIVAPTNGAVEERRYRGFRYQTKESELSAQVLAARAAQPKAGESQDRVYRGVRYREDGERYAPERIKVTQPSDNKLLQWFYNQRVADKQLSGLLVSKLISLVLLLLVSGYMLTRYGYRQLLNQAVSELTATSSSLENQASGTAPTDGVLLEAAEAYAELDSLDDVLEQDTRAALQARLDINQLEYIALVDLDLEIIANGNIDRSGNLLNPNNLVSSALRQNEVKSAISLQTIAELQQLGIAVPSTVNEAALVQFTVLPIFETGQPADSVGVSNPVIGALVTGDILNADAPAVQNSLSGLREGYVEIYLQEPSGSFDLVVSSQEGEVGVASATGGAYDFNFLERAIQAASGDQSRGVVNESFELVDRNTHYTVVAKAIVDATGKPIGVIQHGLSETELRSWRRNAIGVLVGTALLALLADVVIAKLLGRSIVKPLRKLQAATERFASGDRTTRAKVFSTDEVGRVASAFNELAAAVSTSESSLRFQSETQTESARRARTLSELTSDIRQNLEEEAIFSTSVERAREVLAVDRVVIYRFNPGYTGGDVSAESVGKGWSRARGQHLEDPMLPDSVDRFMTGQVSTVENIETEDLTECHCRLLRELEVKANMVAPVIVGDKLVALLCAHQCSSPRQWQPEEVNMIQQIATQVGYALAQAKLLDTQKQAVRQEQQLSELVASIRSTTEQEKIFRSVTRQVKLAIDTSRVVIYLFDENWKGTVVAEAVDTQWPPALGAKIADPCFADRYVDQYRSGRVKATSDIYNAGLTDCHIGQLEPFAVRANLVAPVVTEDKLLGLLIAHECTGPRDWSDVSINFIQRAATQLGFALEQAEATRAKELAVNEMSSLAEERMERQERLQMQLVDLLGEVEAAAQGDLTVKADVTAGEIGTVADFFNAIIENLRVVVTQVKHSAHQVNDSLGQNESAIRLLAEEALQQAEQTTLTLDSVGVMTASIQQVAQQAEEAAEVARVASETATQGGEAMDLTVSNIMSLRQTVGQTAKKVKRLGESSQQITKAVLLINQISQQTNLLAINAGIEAARAGEDGQGFAAVAEEVGELATRSASATEEIERIVEAIQRETGDVVEAIEQSTAQVVEGTRRVEDAKASLTQILDGSQKMDELARMISEATSSQVATSSTVSALMGEIAQLATRTSESSRQVSEALNQTVTVAQDLQEQVATFTVEDEPGQGGFYGG